MVKFEEKLQIFRVQKISNYDFHSVWKKNKSDLDVKKIIANSHPSPKG